MQRTKTGCDCILQIYDKSYMRQHCLLPTAPLSSNDAGPFTQQVSQILPQGQEDVFT